MSVQKLSRRSAIGGAAALGFLPRPAFEVTRTESLTLESLGMRKSRIALRDRSLRLFNNRGSVAFRDRTVTGLKAMIFPPFNLSDPQADPLPPLSDSGHFNLSFREMTTGALIQDIQDEMGDPLYFNQKPLSSGPLGPHYSKTASTLLMLLQGGVWRPDRYVRRGTFHWLESGHLISFGLESTTMLSSTDDAVLLQISVENRLDGPLVLTVIPDFPVPGQPRHPRFERAYPQGTLAVESNLPRTGAEGWHLKIPAHGQATGFFRLTVTPGSAVTIERSMEESTAWITHSLTHASSTLPTLRTENKRLLDFYNRSILSVLLCRRERSNFVVNPFYDLGFSRGASTPWDMAFSGDLLAQLDPEGLRTMLLAFFSSGSALACTYLSWEGKPSGFYAQTPFSLWQMTNDYIRHTGNVEFLNERAGSITVWRCLRNAADELLNEYVGADGLLDVGAGTKKMLEIRTEGYQHKIPTVNALAADYFEDVAHVMVSRGESGSDRLAKAAARMRAATASVLWDPAKAWFDCLYPDGTRHTVLSYHTFDMLGSRSISDDMKKKIAGRIAPGEFLGDYGMYSIAPNDRAHFDLEDCDWGGGGQYVGQSLKIAELLFRLGEGRRGWDTLSRCTQWADCFPYFPQTIYTERLSLQDHQIDWPLQISAGAGAQAVIAGLFGFRPQNDGSIVVAPYFTPDVGRAELTNCRFRGHTYTVRLEEKQWMLSEGGQVIKSGRYGHEFRLRAAVV